jgi:large subunit ribosomal protein L29
MTAGKSLRAKELMGNEPESLQAQLKTLEEELFKNRLKQMTNQLENTMVIRNARRNIARIRTVLGQKSRDASQAASQAAKAAPETTKG